MGQVSPGKRCWEGAPAARDSPFREEAVEKCDLLTSNARFLVLLSPAESCLLERISPEVLCHFVVSVHSQIFA